MLILGLDTATRVCGVSLLKEDILVAEYTQNLNKTHSQRLMPLIHHILTDTGHLPADLTAVAVASGPGSFTGIRIGVATARGLAQGLGIAAVGVSTLRALAESIPAPGNLICPILDARRSQVYTSLYRCSRKEKGAQTQTELTELLPPSALSLSILLEKLLTYSEPVIFCGDGLPVFVPMLREELGGRCLEVIHPLTLNRASVVAWCARRQLLEHPGDYPYARLLPVYLRAPEAERLYQAKEDSRVAD